MRAYRVNPVSGKLQLLLFVVVGLFALGVLVGQGGGRGDRVVGDRAIESWDATACDFNGVGGSISLNSECEAAFVDGAWVDWARSIDSCLGGGMVVSSLVGQVLGSDSWGNVASAIARCGRMKISRNLYGKRELFAQLGVDVF